MLPVNRRLEVTLAKSEEGVMWPEVVEGNPDGQYVVDADQARIIHERLAHLTSQQLVRFRISLFSCSVNQKSHQQHQCSLSTSHTEGSSYRLFT